jgi:uncharacterized protein
MKTTRYAYLHGFASSAAAKKGVHLRGVLAARGVELLLPDLNQPSFEKLSVGAMLAHLDALHAEHGEPRWRLVGSSLGGWLAARWAELQPERVERMVLLCPAFDIPTRWPLLLPPGAFERWQRDGELPYADAEGRIVPLHYGFYEEAAEHTRFPSVGCPVTVVHGSRDDRVPIQSSRTWIADHPQARLVTVDDGHDLLASLPAIERVIADTFGI